jgi:putative tryptophan/tyrosine transport system substrate-binding protein
VDWRAEDAPKVEEVKGAGILGRIHFRTAAEHGTVLGHQMTTRAVVLHHPVEIWSKFDTTAQKLGLELLRVEASAPDELDGAFAQMTKEGAQAFLVAPSGLFLAQRERIVNLAGKSRLPAIYGFREYVEAGGLMSYGISFRDQAARAAGYVDKILKGAKSSQLPVEQGSKVELVVNAKTAKRLGISLPQTILLRADKVIE